MTGDEGAQNASAPHGVAGGVTTAPPAAPRLLKPGSREWLRLVTPSKVAPILGISPYTDQYSQWHIMRGNITEPETDEMRRGTFHEAGVLREFYHRHPELVREHNGHRTIRAAEWLAATPDSIAIPRNPARRPHRVLVEIKTCAGWDDWGRTGTDEIPEHYLSQVLPCAYVAEVDEIRVFALGPFWEYREYVVAPDIALAEATLAKCYEFWQTVQSGDEPPLSHTVSSYETWTKVADPEVGEGSVEIPADAALRLLRAIAGEKDVKPARAAIVNLLGDAKVATFDGKTVAQKQRNSVGGVTLAVGRKPPTINALMGIAS